MEHGYIHFQKAKCVRKLNPIRIKWGTASLIVRAPVTRIVLPIVHPGLEKVMPEKYMFSRRPLVPLSGRNIRITIGQPIEFDIPKLKQTAISESRNSSHSGVGWPIRPCGLDKAAQRYVYKTISEHNDRIAMDRLRNLGKVGKV